jgi:hypothetical protein
MEASCTVPTPICTVPAMQHALYLVDAAGAWWEPLHALYQSTIPLSLTKASQQYHAYIYVYDHSHYHQFHAALPYSFIAYKHFGGVMPMQ